MVLKEQAAGKALANRALSALVSQCGDLPLKKKKRGSLEMIKKRRKEFCRCCTQGSLYSEGNSMPSAPVRAMLEHGACVLVWGNLGILFLLHSLPVSFIP